MKVSRRRRRLRGTVGGICDVNGTDCAGKVSGATNGDTNGRPGVALVLCDPAEGKDIGQHRHHVLVLVQRDRLERAVIRHPELLARREVVGDVLHLNKGQLLVLRWRARARHQRIDEVAQNHAAFQRLLKGALELFAEDGLNPGACLGLHFRVVLGRRLFGKLFIEAVEKLATRLRSALIRRHVRARLVEAGGKGHM